MDEVKEILDEIFYKDIRGIIESFLIVECKDCRKEILEDNSLESCDNKFYCVKCSKSPFISKCVECCKYYSINDNRLKCFLCFSLSCKLYCDRCYIFKGISIESIEMDMPHLDLYWTTNDIDLIREYLDEEINVGYLAIIHMDNLSD